MDIIKVEFKSNNDNLNAKALRTRGMSALLSLSLHYLVHHFMNSLPNTISCISPFGQVTTLASKVGVKGLTQTLVVLRPIWSTAAL